MKKILIPALCAVMVILSLAGCGGNKPAAASASPLPSAAAVTGGSTSAASASPATSTAAGTSGSIPTPTPSTAPSVAPGTVVTFTAKITSASGKSLHIDVQNSSIVLSSPGQPVPSASPSPETAPDMPSPSPTKEVATSVTIDVPANAKITLSDGKSGKVSDIKAGQTATFTQIDNVITAIALQK